MSCKLLRRVLIIKYILYTCSLLEIMFKNNFWYKYAIFLIHDEPEGSTSLSVFT